MDIRRLLQNTDLFSSLREDDLNFIAKNTEIKKFKQGQLVFNKGGAAIHFYIIKSGEVSIRQVTDEKDTRDLAQYITGESFGEFGFITGALHDVEALAQRDSTLLLFPAFPQTLESLSLERPKTMCRLYLKSVEILTKRSHGVQTMISENSPWVKQSQELMNIDLLTGLYKKQYLDSEIPRLLKVPVAVIVLKPDRFKDLNEKYGHQAGDAVLTRIGRLLLDIVERDAKGFAVRLQSNEMALILLESDTEEALETARVIHKTIKTIGPSLQVDSRNAAKNPGTGTDLRLTASISIGFYRDKKQEFSHVVTNVYRSMYQLWKEGGNKISIQKGQHDAS